MRADTGGASHIVFIVRDDTSTSDLLFQTSDTSWQAYNDYTASLYGTATTEFDQANRAYKVSYNRPFFTRGMESGVSWVFNAEYPMVRWLESNGYDVSYFSGVDSARYGNLIRNHKVFLSVGHDEYWSGEQRTNVETARDAGVDLAFFSGNAVFWKTRWENSIDGTNTPYRTLVCYKETHDNAAIDPLDASPTWTWTGTWRDPRFSPPADGGRPENALMGTIFMVNGPRVPGDAIQVPAEDGKMRFWRNTSIANLAAGQTATLPVGTLGFEWDEDLDNGFRPPGLLRMSSTTVDMSVDYLLDYGTNFGAGTATHHLALYRDPISKALVFGGGTVQWSWGLDANHDMGVYGTPAQPADARMQQATVNLFADMGVQPGTLQTSLVSASASTDTIAPTSTVTFPTAGTNLPVGSSATVTGTAIDAGGGVVGGVEVTVDGGLTWHPANGRGTWRYTWMPMAAGSVIIKSRAVDDTGNLENPSAGVSITVGGGDTTAPTVTMTAPGVGATVSGTAVTVSANASDNVGVTSVQFLLDGDALGSADTSAPYSITWNSTTAANGAHTLSARASDAAGNTTTATGVAVTVSNDTTAPTVAMTAPGLGATVSGTAVTVSANASDDVGVTSVQFLVDGVALGAADTSAPYSITWDSTTAANGTHTLSARASDAAGNTTTATGVAVTVSNDTTAPTVAMTAPGLGATVSGTAVTVSANASDDVGVTSVQFLVDGVALGAADTSAPYSITWDSTTAANGTHTLSARASDAAGNTTTATGVAVTVSNDTTAPTVAMTAPGLGATVSGTAVTVSANASDDVGVTSVQFLVDGVALGAADTSAPYSITWDSTTAANGTHTLSARASDAAGNTTTATGVAVTVSNDTTAPTVAMTAPGLGATVSGTAVTVSANASDDVGVTSVQFLVDGVALGAADTSAPYSITWDSTTAANGTHTLSARASDAAGNTTTATGVAVTVSNVADTTAPTVTAQTPAAGAAGVATGTTVTATFSEAVDAPTVSSATVTLQGPSGAVGAAVSYNAAASTATLTPSATLAVSTTYTATVTGGATGVKDLAGNALVADVTWSFTTAGATVTTAFQAPTANAPVTASAGDNNGFQTSPTNAYASDGLFAVDTNSGTNTNTSCTNSGKDKHLYYGVQLCSACRCDHPWRRSPVGCQGR